MFTRLAGVIAARQGKFTKLNDERINISKTSTGVKNIKKFC